VSVWAVLRHSLTPLSSASLLSARRAAHCLPLPQAWRRTASALPAAAHAGTRGTVKAVLVSQRAAELRA